MKSARLLAGVFALGLVAGCTVKSGWMKYSAPTAPPDETKVKIVFYRTPAYTGYNQKWDVWDGETFVGSAENGGYFEYSCAPGTHFFHVMGGFTLGEGTAIEGDLAGGKTYFIRVKIGTGLVPASADTPDDAKWEYDFGRCSCRELRPDKIEEANQAASREKAKAHALEIQSQRADQITRIGVQEGR